MLSRKSSAILLLDLEISSAEKSWVNFLYSSDTKYSVGMVCDNQSLQIIFPDEKKKNLDSPDGYEYYCHNLGRGTAFFQNFIEVVDML
ncbi:hypothetical protein AVEN_235246-1 [Araneus ventricosus]|uniref:Uncharacterized protein n=1 Tax=Araneus ventricosus TaxID=182803 RepID=A0A4Y2A3F7_ARAVE|nr:hypothetical protein AVEN_235246-1 [Araneus ventricosus]